MLEASLPQQVFAKYQDAVTREVIKSAKIENLISCRQCNLQVEMAADAGSVAEECSIKLICCNVYIYLLCNADVFVYLYSTGTFVYIIFPFI